MESLPSQPSDADTITPKPQASIWDHPLANVLIGALIGVVGTLLVPWISSHENVSLEREKLRNAALADTRAVHEIPAGTSQALANATEGARQLYYYTLASPLAVHIAAREKAKGRGDCINDMRPACRDLFLQQVKASRIELGSGDVSDADLALALKPIFDRLETSIQSGLDDGSATINRQATGEPLWYVYGGGSVAEIDPLVKAAMTPAFLDRFPTNRYGLVLQTGTAGDGKDSFCYAQAGVSGVSAGIKTMRIPAFRELSNHRLAQGASVEDQAACRAETIKAALKNLMAADPSELARTTANSL